MLMKAAMLGRAAEFLQQFSACAAAPAAQLAANPHPVPGDHVGLKDLIYPIFVEEELDDFAPVESMPGVVRIPEQKLDAAK